MIGSNDQKLAEQRSVKTGEIEMGIWYTHRILLRICFPYPLCDTSNPLPSFEKLNALSSLRGGLDENFLPAASVVARDRVVGEVVCGVGRHVGGRLEGRVVRKHDRKMSRACHRNVSDFIVQLKGGLDRGLCGCARDWQECLTLVST